MCFFIECTSIEGGNEAEPASCCCGQLIRALKIAGSEGASLHDVPSDPFDCVSLFTFICMKNAVGHTAFRSDCQVL